MKIAIYNQNCILKGQESFEVEIDNEGRAIGKNGLECNDVTVYDVTRDELSQLQLMHSTAQHSGDRMYLGLVIETLAAYL